MDIIIRFLKKIQIKDNGCWEWIASKSWKGYGQIGNNEKIVYAHRFIFEYYYGSICPDLQIDHLCRNRACVNPLHLQQVSQTENQHRGFGPCGINWRKINCKYGHEFTQENTYIRPNGNRSCNKCNVIKQQKLRDKIKSEPEKYRISLESKKIYMRNYRKNVAT